LDHWQLTGLGEEFFLGGCVEPKPVADCLLPRSFEESGKETMKHPLGRYRTFLLLAAGLLFVFVCRTLLAARYHLPTLDDLFTIVTVVGSLVLLIKRYRCLRELDWAVAIALGGAVGLGMLFETLFMPYPFLGITHSNLEQALVRGCCSALAVLGGIVVMRQGGPVQFRAANGEWRTFGVSLLWGLGTGAPLAMLNVYALQLTQGQGINWQDPFAALLDAFQPGIVEEVIYRFAFLGLLWLALRNSLPDWAALFSGLLALLVHSFVHFGDQFQQTPLVALGMGLVMAIVWGIPLTVLALRRDIDSAIAFHWIQDAGRFLAGF
jgi:hypothetical protein